MLYIDSDQYANSFFNIARSVHPYLCISDLTRRWCTLEGGFLSYYESERRASAIGRVDVTEVVSLAASSTETMTGAG